MGGWAGGRWAVGVPPGRKRRGKEGGREKPPGERRERLKREKADDFVTQIVRKKVLFLEYKGKVGGGGGR